MAGKRMQIKHKNCYDPLFNELECYICHNYGHKAADCRLKNYNPFSNHRAKDNNVWNKKEDSECGLVLASQRQNNPWYIGSGCSSHMKGDKSKFLSLKECKSGNLTFRNDAPGKIGGKGLLIICNGRTKFQYVLFFDRLKHNILSVSQECDKGCEVTFTAKDCKIKIVNIGELIAIKIRRNAI
jgi:hypothetical protein